MEKIYDFTVSGIDSNGQQYMTGMLEPERLDEHGLRVGKAFSFELDHKKQKTTLCRFTWVHGCPNNFDVVASLKNEIISESEIMPLLKKYKMI